MNVDENICIFFTEKLATVGVSKRLVLLPLWTAAAAAATTTTIIIVGGK